MAFALERVTPRSRLVAGIAAATIAALVALWALVFVAPGSPPAGATGTTTVPLHSSQIGATASGFGGQDCSDLAPGAGEDGWHFVIPGTDSPSFLSVSVTFEYPGGGQFTVAASINPSNPKHAYAYTPAGVTLVGGTAQVQGDGDYPFFNLSHTCPGETVQTTPPVTTVPPEETQPPTTPPAETTIPPLGTTVPPVTTTPPATTTVPVATTPVETTVPPESTTPVESTTPMETTSPAVVPSESTTVVLENEEETSMPLTGVAIAGYVAGGALLLAAGAALVIAARRRAAGGER
jgi:hypothetical protein